MAIYIYGLRCPLSDAIRYIGKAVNAESRLQQHLARCKRRRTYCDKWLDQLGNAGLRPSVVILRELEDGQDWAAAERQEIAAAKAKGWPLTNLTEGGDGFNPTPEGRERHLAASRKADRRQRISEGRKRFLVDPAERAKVAENNKRRANDPDARERQREALRQYWADPKRSAAHRSTITTAKRLKEKSERMKTLWADPAYRARLSAAYKAAWQKRKDSR